MWDLWILLATRSFEEDAIIGNNSVILRETIGIASNVAIVFTMFVRVSLKIFHVCLSRSATIFVKSRERRFAREKSVLPDASVRDKYRCHARSWNR